MRPNSPSRDGTPQTAGSGGTGAGPGSGTRGSAAPSSGSGTAAVSAPATSRTGKISSAASRRDRDRDGGDRGTVQTLEINRKVAFKAPPKKDPETGRMEAAQWILATVKAFIPPKSYVLLRSPRLLFFGGFSCQRFLFHLEQIRGRRCR